MAVRHTRQYQQADRNPLDFDNDFGGRNISDPYDGTSTYIPFDDMRGGGTYTPPTPPNNTFVPPSNAQDLINGSIIINLIAKSINNLDFVDVEFLEDDVSKGIGSTSRVVYSPAINFGSKRIYKATSAGKISNNYFEVEVVKTFTNLRYQFDNLTIYEPGSNDQVIQNPNNSGITRRGLPTQGIGTYFYRK